MTRVHGTDGSRELDVDVALAAAGKGEHWALSALFRAYQAPLVRYLRAQEPNVADDLAAEVWMSVARGMARFVGDEVGFRGWLFTIARRRVIDHRRRQTRRRTDPVPDERLDRPVEEGELGDPAVLVVGQVSAQEAIELLVAGLTDDQVEAVLLRVVAGLEVGDVARIMERTPGSVRVLCHRALRRIAVRLSGEVLAE